MLYSSYPSLMFTVHTHAQLQSDINVQEFVLELLEETRMYENNKKVRLHQFYLCIFTLHIHTDNIGSIYYADMMYTVCINQCHSNVMNVHVLQLQFLAGMSEKIVQGIETAESDLSKEKEKKSQEEVGGPIIYSTNIHSLGHFVNHYYPTTFT